MRSDTGGTHQGGVNNINFVEGLGVRMPDGIIHACRNVSHTLCGLEIPDEARMAALRQVRCERCAEAMGEEVQ